MLTYLPSHLSQNLRLIVLTPVQVIRAVLINNIPCDKGRISSNDNINIDTIAWMLRPAVLIPLPRGVVLLAVYSQNGCDDQRETETGIKQSEIG